MLLLIYLEDVFLMFLDYLYFVYLSLLINFILKVYQINDVRLSLLYCTSFHTFLIMLSLMIILTNITFHLLYLTFTNQI
jgi:hypothetical protein